MTDNRNNDNKNYGSDKSDGQPNDPASSTQMTDQQAVTNDVATRPGRGAQQEPGAYSEDAVNRNIIPDAEGTRSDDNNDNN